MNLTIKGQTFDLTLEEVEAVKSQLKNKLPTTWEECIDSQPNGGYYISTGSIISRIVKLQTADEFQNIVPTEKHAKSVLAMCQLMTITEALNRTLKIQEDSYEVFYEIVGKQFLTTTASYVSSCPIQFNSRELAEHAIKHFEQLFLDYFMIER